MLEVLLLDDDERFLNILRQQTEQGLLQRGFSPRFHMAATAQEAAEQINSIQSLDLALLDIDMGTENTSGLQVAKALQEVFPDCGIAFVTSYLNYATEVYEVQPFYFILKDQLQDRIGAALDIFQKKYIQAQKTVAVNVGRKERLIPVESILYFEHQNRRTRMVTTTEVLMIWDSLQTLEKKLPAGLFASSHKSYLIGLRWIANYDRTAVILVTGHRLPISRTRRDGFQQKVRQYIKAELT